MSYVWLGVVGKVRGQVNGHGASKKEAVLTIESCIINENNMFLFGTLFRNLFSTLMKKYSS